MRELYQPSMQEFKLSKILYALSDPLRLNIVKNLLKYNEVCCSDCRTAYDVPKSTLSHHIKVLRECGIISIRIEGKYHFYLLRKLELEKCFPGLMNAISRVSDELI